MTSLLSMLWAYPPPLSHPPLLRPGGQQQFSSQYGGVGNAQQYFRSRNPSTFSAGTRSPGIRSIRLAGRVTRVPASCDY